MLPTQPQVAHLLALKGTVVEMAELVNPALTIPALVVVPQVTQAMVVMHIMQGQVAVAVAPPALFKWQDQEEVLAPMEKVLAEQQDQRIQVLLKDSERLMAGQDLAAPARFMVAAVVVVEMAQRFRNLELVEEEVPSESFGVPADLIHQQIPLTFDGA
jgi:sorbitol-specific phosphotransferase system component IIBC